MIYLEITYAQKDEAKLFGVRWDPKEKLWYFPGDVLPQELERFRPSNVLKGTVEQIILKIILDIHFSYRDTAARAGAFVVGFLRSFIGPREMLFGVRPGIERSTLTSLACRYAQ